MIESLRKQEIGWEELEKELVSSIFAVEKELGHFIDEDYPYMKFLIELEELEKYLEKQQNQL